MTGKKLLKKNRLNTLAIIALSFAAVILAGTALLCLPWSTKAGNSCSFINALFTATSAVCVTGLSVFDTYSYWTVFGQIVILILIQIGGLGFMSAVSGAFYLFKHQVNFQQRYIMMQSFNLNGIDGLKKLLKYVFLGTLIIECSGAAVLSVFFCRDYGIAGGIYRGIFHSVSAFCNAGFDVLGTGSSFASYSGNAGVLLTLSALIILGGLGFFVWQDIISKKFKFKRFNLHTKIVLLTSCALIFVGAVLFYVTEFKSGAISDMGPFEGVLNAFFQSVTTRTAGFASFDQASLSPVGKAITCVLMVIGGSPGSTAGGIKTVTVCVLFLYLIGALRGRNELNIFGRNISGDQIRQAMFLLIIALIVDVFGACLISAIESVPITSALYEAVSAYGTVGLSLGLTGSLSAFSKLLLIFMMFLGRVGILTVSISFLAGKGDNAKIRYPAEKLMIG